MCVCSYKCVHIFLVCVHIYFCKCVYIFPCLFICVMHALNSSTELYFSGALLSVILIAPLLSVC